MEALQLLHNEQSINTIRIKNTYTFEDRHMKWWEKQFRSLIAPPGGMPGYNVVPHEAKWIGARAFDAAEEALE